MADVILTLTLNPAVDLTYTVPQLRRGHTNRISTVARRAGGKGINVASVLQDLGAEPLALLPLGGTSGQEIAEDLDARGIDHVAVPLANAIRQTIAVIEPGETTNFSEPGPHITAAEWRALVSGSANSARRANAVVVSGSLPPGIGPEAFGELVRSCAQHAPVLADVSGEYLLAAARAGAAVLAPNAEELASAFPGEETAVAARRLIALGAESCLISLGADGLRFISAEEDLVRSAVPGVVGNTTGAGDAALAAFTLLRFEEEGSLRQALVSAAAAGAAAVTEPVAGVLSPETYRAFVSILNPF